MAILAMTFDSSTGKMLAQLLGPSQIAAGAVVSASIGSGVIATPHIHGFLSGHVIIGQGSGTVPTYDFPPAGAPGDNTITSAKIASGQVGDGHIYPASILSSKIASGIIGIPHLQPWASGQLLVGQGTGVTPITKDHMAAIAFVIDGFGSGIQSGGKGHLQIPFPGTISECTLLADQSGYLSLDIQKDTFSNYPPTAADSICSSFKPTISSVIKYRDTVLSGWNKSIASGDILYYMVENNASSIQRVTISLGVYK